MDDFFTGITNQAIKVTLMIASPMLIGAMVMGIIISLLQAVTQIYEQTMSFIPKIIVIAGAMVIFSPWMSATLIDFTKELYINIPNVVANR